MASQKISNEYSAEVGVKEVKMKISVTTVLYSMLALMHFVWLTNHTLLSGEWSGIALAISTGLFIIGTALFLMNRNPKE